MAYNFFPQFPVQNYQQNQNNGFVSVRNEQEARNYPVAYGNSVTFKDETSPYVYTKTMGFSQLDPPVFEKYKLVKEEVTPPKENGIREELDSIWSAINELKEKHYGHESNKSVSSKPNGNVKSEIQNTSKP